MNRETRTKILILYVHNLELAKAGVTHIRIMCFQSWHVCKWAHMTVLAGLEMGFIASKSGLFLNYFVAQIYFSTVEMVSRCIQL